MKKGGKKAGGKKLEPVSNQMRKSVEDDNHAHILAMEFIWSDQKDKVWEDQFGVDNEISERVFFDRCATCFWFVWAHLIQDRQPLDIRMITIVLIFNGVCECECMRMVVSCSMLCSQFILRRNVQHSTLRT